MAIKEVPAQEIETDYSKITRNDFPRDFVFGTATSAYQVEGGAAEGGRGLSVWDAFTLTTPKKIMDGSNGNEAVDMYTRYKEDIKMMKNMGFDAYRFSISWSRILPGGKVSLGVNREGIDYYNDLINTLLANGIEPYVTLFHWDLPFTLEQEYGGFLSKDVVNDFRDYAELCFWEFGDRVKHWITINEPTTYSIHGYVGCTFPPSKLDPKLNMPKQPKPDPPAAAPSVQEINDNVVGRRAPLEISSIKSYYKADCASQSGSNFIPARGSTPVEKNIDLIYNGVTNQEIINAMFPNQQTWNSIVIPRNLTVNLDDKGTVAQKLMASEDPPKFFADYITNMAKDAYTVGRNLLLAHAAAANSYMDKFKAHQNGIIGITLVTHWFEPYNSSKQEDKDAAERALDFNLGWYLEPILTGRYPKNMIDFVPEENLASFTDEESKLLKGSIDFLGLNYYTAYWVEDDPTPDVIVGYNKDMHIRSYKQRKEDETKIIGPQSGADWLCVVPWGIKKLLTKVKEKYDNLPDIYITENGIADLKNDKLTANEACRDEMRVKYYQDHLGKIKESIDAGVKVKGYFAWSFCDNFEWKDGYRYRFGMIYIDYVNNLKRYPKDSAMWFAKFLENEKKIEDVVWFAKFLEEMKKKIDNAMEHAKLLEEKKGDEKEGEKKDEKKEYPFFENPFM